MRRNSLNLAEKERIIREFVSMHKLNVGPNMVRSCRPSSSIASR
jgi:hypothetical protein